MLWSYYGTGHGKGEWDGAGAVVKRALRTEQLLNPQRRLQNAADCVDFLESSMGGQVASRYGGIRFSLPLLVLFLHACACCFPSSAVGLPEVL